MDAVPAPTLPPSLPRWFPFLWRRVLFPGKTPQREPLNIVSLFLLLLLPGLLLYPCLSFALFEPDETRYAQIPREMLERGEWIVPHLQDEPYLDKPPLFYWLVMASYSLFGVHEVAARLIPALALHLSILSVYLFGRRHLGERAAFWGALLLAFAPGFLGMGRLLILDGVLTLWTTLALFAAFEALRRERLHWGWWLLSATLCGFGVLTKGPVALILLAPPLLLFGLLDGGFCRVSWAAFAAFGLVVLCLVLPWYIAVCVSIPEFARHFFWEHNVMRFVAPFDHLRGVWFYVPIALAGMLPGTLFLLPFFKFLLSGKEDIAERRCPELGFLLVAGSWCLLFFTLSGCKLPTYILPAFPPLALALGYILTRQTHLPRSLVPLAILSFVLLGACNYVVLPWYADYRSPTRDPERLARHCGESESVVCYPRPCHAASFYLGRSDLKNYRSKDIEELRTLVRRQPRTVILCTHRHSLEGLRQLLPPEVEIVATSHFGLDAIPGLPSEMQGQAKKLLGETALGLCDIAVVERRPPTRNRLTLFVPR